MANNKTNVDYIALQGMLNEVVYTVNRKVKLSIEQLEACSIVIGLAERYMDEIFESMSEEEVHQWSDNDHNTNVDYIALQKMIYEILCNIKNNIHDLEACDTVLGLADIYLTQDMPYEEHIKWHKNNDIVVNEYGDTLRDTIGDAITGYYEDIRSQWDIYN